MIAQKGSFCRTYLSSHIAFVIVVSGGFYMEKNCGAHQTCSILMEAALVKKAFG